MHTRIFLAAALGAALTATTTTALAQDHRGGFESRWERSRVWLTTDLFPTQDWMVAAMGLSGQIEVVPHFALDVDLSWAAGDLSGGPFGDRQVGGAFGNITLGGHGMFHVTRNVLVFGGMTFTIPTRYDFTDASEISLLVQSLGAVSRGYADVHRLYPGTFFARIPLGAEVHFADYFYYRGDLVPVIMAPVAKGFADKSVQLFIEHSDEIEARAPFGFGGGLRFQVTFAPTSSIDATAGLGFGGGSDHAQAALEPFIGYEPRRAGLFARLGVLVALDTPLGFGFEADKMATVRTTIGGKF